MPWKKNGKRVPAGTNAKARAGVAAKKAAKSGKGWTDAQMQAAARQAAERVVNKSIETQYSQALVTLSSATAPGTSPSPWMLPPLNRQAAIYDSTAVLVFNMCYLSQVGQSTLPGFRLGQRINAKSFTIAIDINAPQSASDCSYNWCVVRRKNDAPNQTAYSTPTVLGGGVVGLFKPLTDGPYASVAGYYGGTGGVTVGNSSVPMPYYLSSTRRNTDEWSWVTGSSGSVNIPGMPIQTPDVTPATSTTPASAITEQRYCPHVSKKMYLALGDGGQDWDFVTRGGSDVKGGNYFFMLWREGPPHIGLAAEPENASANSGGHSISCYFELAYKDG